MPTAISSKKTGPWIRTAPFTEVASPQTMLQPKGQYRPTSSYPLRGNRF